jgi:hypothetical protein
MHFDFYDSASGKLIGTSAFFDFGNIIQGQHSQVPTVLRAMSDQEPNISNLKLYLTSKGLVQADFRYYVNSLFQPNIESGASLFSNFVEVSDASSTSPNDVPIGWDTTSSYYVWFDINTPSNKAGLNESEFRLFFDHS